MKNAVPERRATISSMPEIPLRLKRVLSMMTVKMWKAEREMMRRRAAPLKSAHEAARRRRRSGKEGFVLGVIFIVEDCIFCFFEEFLSVDIASIDFIDPAIGNVAES